MLASRRSAPRALAWMPLLFSLLPLSCGSDGATPGSANLGGAGGSSSGGSASGGGTGAGAGGAGGSSGSTGTGGTGAGGTAGGAGGSSSGGSSAGGSSGAGTGGTAGSGGSGGGGPGASTTFRVSGRKLYDRCGEEVILRGVNEMIVWSGGKDGVPEYAEIAKTGANAVRIVWNEEGNAAELDAAITNAVAQKLIPMVEHHGATGDLSAVPDVVDYWTQSSVATVLKEHQAYLLLNIANEPGEDEEQANWVNVYKAAITEIRATGFEAPLIIDAPQWGQDIDMLQAAGPSLIEHDPEHNLMFSVHMWWDDPSGSRVVSELSQSVSQNLPLVVGEFAQHAVAGCDDNPFSYTTLLAEAQEHGIGWLAWSWGSVDNSDCSNEGSFDMTEGGTFGNWEEPWGQAVAITDPNSIQNTSVRPASMVNGACAP